MEASFVLNGIQNKKEHYEAFLKQYACLIKGETNETSVLANTCAALKEAFGFFWVGFYMVKNGSLALGPFQGSVACYRIEKGRGVCGTAWAKACTIVVPDVNAFPGHIACSPLSRSEIVVPIIAGNEVKGVLDIDSDKLNAFDETDKVCLEKAISLLTEELYQFTTER